MTYCVATMIDAGIVFASDSRTNAGVDNISTFRKMKTFERPGDRALVLVNSGNLASPRRPSITSNRRSGTATSPT